MVKKQYPAIYQRIAQYYKLVAQAHNIAVADQASYASRLADRAYRVACKHINAGRFTEDQVMAAYPLD